MKRIPATIIAGTMLAAVACGTAPAATPAPPSAAASTPVVDAPGAPSERIVRATPSTRIDRGDDFPTLVREVERASGDLRLHTWVSRVELTPTDEFMVFASVQRDGSPVADAPVLMMLSGTTSGAVSTNRVMTGPDGVASLKLAGSAFRLAQPSQILVSAGDGDKQVEAELWILVDRDAPASS